MRLSQNSPGSLTIPVIVAAALLLPACGGDDNPPNPTGGGGPDPVGANGDEIVISVDGAAQQSFVEASGLPDIDCDPRVDWAANQVILWHDHTGGAGPSGYELFLSIVFPNADSVGTYTVHGDFLQAVLYLNGVNYSASPIVRASSGSVTVTRSDTRIEGPYTLNMVDSSGQDSLTLTGSFAVDAGWSLSCP
jgi:hypothetical protein